MLEMINFVFPITAFMVSFPGGDQIAPLVTMAVWRRLSIDE